MKKFIFNSKDGFTLAETIITLGIIGIVAAITLPSLIQNYKDFVLISQAKKSYSNFLNVLNRMKAENDCTDYACIFSNGESALEVANSISKYYNGAKVCSAANKGCGSVYYVKLAQPTNNGSGGISKEEFHFPRLIAVDGSSLYFRSIRSSCDKPFTYTTQVVDSNGFYTGETKEVTDYRCGTVIIDINGESKGPNQYGADVHQIKILKDSLSTNSNNYGCLKTIFTDNKLNYTKYSDNTTFNKN